MLRHNVSPANPVSAQTRCPSERRAMNGQQPDILVAHVSIYVIHSKIFVQKCIYISKKMKKQNNKNNQQIQTKKSKVYTGFVNASL